MARCSLVLIRGAFASGRLAASRTDSEPLHNWPQWRGPLTSGVAPQANPPHRVERREEHQVESQVPGDSTATPIVWGDQSFCHAVKTDREGEPAPPPEEFAATSTEPAKGKRGFRTSGEAPKNIYQFIVMCVDRQPARRSGSTWPRKTCRTKAIIPTAAMPRPRPRTDGKQLYVSFGSRGVYCYDLDGKQKWTRDLGRMTIFNSLRRRHVARRSMATRDRQLGPPGRLVPDVCLDAATGETRWKVDRDENTTWATPLMVESSGRTQVIVHGSKRVRSYDLKTGELIWACGGQGPSAIPTPVTDGKLVFAMTGFITNSLYAIPLDSAPATSLSDKRKDRLEARKIKARPTCPRRCLYGDLLYFTAGNKGILSCFNATRRRTDRRKQRLEGIDNIYASPVGAAGHIYFTSREGNTVVVEAGKFEESGDRKEVKLIATNKLDDRFDGSAAIVGNEIFLRGREHLYCIAGSLRNALSILPPHCVLPHPMR